MKLILQYLFLWYLKVRIFDSSKQPSYYVGTTYVTRSNAHGICFMVEVVIRSR